MGGGAQDSFCHAWILKATVMIEQVLLNCCLNNIPIILAQNVLTLFVFIEMKNVKKKNMKKSTVKCK